jgi:putative membrane protein
VGIAKVVKEAYQDPTIDVAFVAVTANKIDIGYAEIAKKKSKNAAVLKFANTMAADHKAVLNQAVALVTKLKVTPKDNAVSKQLLSDAEKTKKKLNSLSGKAFDKAYIDNEVAYHKAVISAIEGLLIPESENAELKKLLLNQNAILV